MTIIVYLAGPEVFLPDGVAVIEAKRRILDENGFAPAAPPSDLGLVGGGTPTERGMEISRRNEELIAAADVCLANLTPFRGLSADVGTVYELGLAAGWGKHVAAYTNDPRQYLDRVAELEGRRRPLRRVEGKVWDSEGMMVEDHGLRDNLMLEGGLALRESVMVVAPTRVEDPARDLEIYTQAVRRLAQQLL